MTAKPRNPRRWTENETSILCAAVEASRRDQDDSSLPIDWISISTLLPGRTNKDCRKRWYKTDELRRKGPWTSDEDQQLQQAIARYGTKWSLVEQHVRTRNADQCAKHWQHTLDPNIHRGPWTEAEDNVLLAAVDDHGRAWSSIASNSFTLRSPTDLKNRYELIHRRSQASQRTTVAPSTSVETNQSTPTDSLDCPNIQNNIQFPETNSELFNLQVDQISHMAWPSEYHSSNTGLLKPTSVNMEVAKNIKHHGFSQALEAEYNETYLDFWPLNSNAVFQQGLSNTRTTDKGKMLSSLSLWAPQEDISVAPTLHNPVSPIPTPELSPSSSATPKYHSSDATQNRKYTLYIDNIDLQEIEGVLDSLGERGLGMQ